MTKIKFIGGKSILLLLFLLLKVTGQILTLLPRSPAYVIDGQELNVTCKSSKTLAVYTFKAIAEDGVTTELGRSARFGNTCEPTNFSFLICNFTSNTFFLTLRKPLHNQLIICESSENRTQIMSNTTIYVQVPVSEVILSPTDKVEVIENISVNFECLARGGRPKANITWYKEQSVVSETSNRSALNGSMYNVYSTLTTSFQIKDLGKKMKCSAVNVKSMTAVESKETIIDVLYPPSGDLSISSSSQTFVYTSGDSVNLTCSVFGGNPIANLSWECSYTDPIPVTRSNSSFAASILFLNVDKTFNNKDCTCTATHPLQKKNTTVMLTVYYESNITSPLQKTYVVNEKENFSLECTVEGNPLSNITWIFSKKGTVVNTSYNSSNCFLKLPSVKCLDHGEYMVFASNGIGRSASDTTKIAVNCEPRLFTTDLQTPDEIGIGTNESLFISVRLLLFPPSNTYEWKFTGNNNKSYPIQNNIFGYEIRNIIFDNEQNITLFKQNVSDKEFGNYSLTVENIVGAFTKIYKVNGARSPLSPFNLTLVCDNPFSITLKWIADFNGGDSQIFHVFSSSGRNSSSFKELGIVDDEGFGRIHSYSPAVALYGQLWFRIAASNKFGNSTTNAVPCFLKTQDESSSNTAMIAGIAAGGGICLAFVVIVVVFYFRKYHKYEKSAKHIKRLNNVNENDKDGADVDGLKENSLYVSAGPRDDEKPEVVVYAAVAKKPPQSDNNSNLYADVKKSERQDTNKGAMSSEVKPKKGFFKKDEKAKHKKGKKPKNRPGETDVYENSEDIVMSTNVNNVCSNAGLKGLDKQERGFKNKDGLLYVEVNFDGKQGQDNPVIHGEDEKTDYATVEFPMPSALHKASGSEEL